MEFIALDFETANHDSTSICQIGAATFKDGKEISTYNQLIRPQPFTFTNKNIQIHGIQASMVKSSPTFIENWPLFKEYIEEKLIICHNAAFDMTVLYNTLQRYHLPLPNITYLCSLQLARAYIKNQTSYSLGKIVPQVLNYSFSHHDALADATACGLLYQYIIEHYTTVSEIYQTYQIGSFTNGKHITFHKK